MQEVGLDHVGDEGRVLLLEHDGHDVVAYVSLPLQLRDKQVNTTSQTAMSSVKKQASRAMTNPKLAPKGSGEPEITTVSKVQLCNEIASRNFCQSFNKPARLAAHEADVCREFKTLWFSQRLPPKAGKKRR